MTSPPLVEDESKSGLGAGSSFSERIADQLLLSQCRNAYGKVFIPAGALSRIITVHSVRQALKAHTDLRSSGIDVADAERICQSYRKIFAILVLVDMAYRIFDFVHLELDDSFLPVSDFGGTDARVLQTSTLKGEVWHTVTKSWRRRDVDHFATYQWRVLAPVFTAHNSDYRLCPSHVLPFEEAHDEAEGAFGMVCRVKIHPDHHEFGELGMSTEDSVFAVKEIRRERDNDYFDTEFEILKKFRYLRIRHVIHLLASYEIWSELDGFSSRRYLIFPCASGDLDAFYRRNEGFSDRPQMILWVAEQSSGIASALSQIHGGSHDPRPGSPGNAIQANQTSVAPQESSRTYLRHGDIKPSNVLWFDKVSSEMGFGQLVLSDFGLAHYHRRTSRSNVSSEGVARSATYRAPEFDTSMKLSRKIDIWSLGCVFLEMLIWLLKGYKAMHVDLPESRLEERVDLSGFLEDTYFRVVQENGRRVAIVKPSIKAWITNLVANPGCTTYIRDILTLIEDHMIVVDVEHRISAAELSKRLGDMYIRCTKDVKYCGESIAGLLSTSSGLLPDSEMGIVSQPASSSPPDSRLDAASVREPVQRDHGAHTELEEMGDDLSAFGTLSRKFRRSAGKMSRLGRSFHIANDKSKGTGQANKPTASGV